MRLRWIAWAALAGLATAALLHSAALVFATLAAATLTVLVTLSRRRIFDSFTFERVPAQRVVPWGGRLDVTLSVTNGKLLPLVWLHVDDEWPPGLEAQGFTLTPSMVKGSQGLSQTFSLRWYERVRRHYQVRCLERGLHHFGPAELEAGDPFGIAGVARHEESREEVVVLPRVLTVEGLDLLLGRPLVESPADHSLARDPTQLRGTRLYQPGDPLRAVNWRATARRATLYTNEFEPTALAAVRLLLDVGVMEHAWQGVDPRRVELLCVVAASLAAALTEAGFGVGLASNARLTDKGQAIDVEATEGGLDDVLETLARIPVAPPDDFCRVIQAELAAAQGEADCLIVTPTLRPAVRDLVVQLRLERPTRVVYVGSPSPEERPLVDALVPPAFDWRTEDALSFTP